MPNKQTNQLTKRYCTK